MIWHLYDYLPGETRSIRVSYQRQVEPRPLAIDACARNVPRARHGFR